MTMMILSDCQHDDKKIKSLEKRQTLKENDNKKLMTFIKIKQY